MIFLILGLVLFLGAHALTSQRAIRRNLIDRFGANGFKGLYSVVSLIGFVLIIYGFGVYRATGWINIWNPPVWTKHLALTLMLPVFVLLALSRKPSWLRDKTKHPMLLAVKIWAASHLIANGDLGSILLFGGFLAWAVLARISTKRRPEEIARQAAAVPTAFGTPDIIALAAGLTFYVATILWLHPLLIGVAVLPGR
jgi:uncharacterized membrane protein